MRFTKEEIKFKILTVKGKHRSMLMSNTTLHHFSRMYVVDGISAPNICEKLPTGGMFDGFTIYQLDEARQEKLSEYLNFDEFTELLQVVAL